MSSAWPSVRDTSRQIGIRYDDWQATLNRAMLAKDRDGLYAADTVAISICRQSGKTFDVGGVVFADSIITPKTTTVWTAHRFKVSRESFNEMQAWARRPEMAPHIEYDDITTAAGNECIPFRNGSRILFAARERGAIRGFTKVRRLVLDEAQILTGSAMSDLVPTTNQAENPQIILMGTPPKPSDPGEVFRSMRTAALAGELDGLLWVEYGADPNCELDDWDAVAQANPSYPKRTTQRDVLRLRKLLTNDDDYRREGLGIWADELLFVHVIPAADWQACESAKSGPVGPVGFALDVNPERTFAAFGVAGRSGLGGTHVEVIERRPGTGWCVARAKELQAKWGGHLAVAKGSPAASLIPELVEAGVSVFEVSTAQHAQACGQVYDLATSHQLKHLGQAELTSAVAAADQRFYGDSWLWSRRTSTGDICALVAITLAVLAFGQLPTVMSSGLVDPNDGAADDDDWEDL